MVETTYHIPGAPRLALLADLHGRDPAPVIASLRRHAPSLIAIAGDILYGSHPEDDKSPLDTQTNVLPFLESCAAIAPSFLSLGNHEWMLDDADLAAISSTGVIVLDNDYQPSASMVERSSSLASQVLTSRITDVSCPPYQPL